MHGKFVSLWLEAPLCCQGMDIMSSLCQLPTELKGMVGLANTHRGKGSGDNQQSHTQFL
jgi:hypothetical protein